VAEKGKPFTEKKGLTAECAENAEKSATLRPRRGGSVTGTPNSIDETIRGIAQAVVDAVNPGRIILFGSMARGKTGPDSDVDLLVVEEESSFQSGSRWAESALIRRALWRFPVPIDVLLFTPEEMEKWKDATNHVIARSVKEGKVLYDRP
jgi:predicted nucleotidyltransferase